MQPRRARLVAAGVAAVVLAGCASAPEQAVSAPSPAGPTVPSPAAGGQPPTLLVPSEPFGLATIGLLAPDGHRVDVPVYVAADDETRQRGLMGRKELPSEAGMVFVFGEETSGAFWMKDTVIPLSIAYYDGDGRVVRVLDMPPCTADPCPTYDPEATYVGALEVNQGYFQRIGLTPEWKVELPAELGQ